MKERLLGILRKKDKEGGEKGRKGRGWFDGECREEKRKVRRKLGGKGKKGKERSIRK